MARSANMRRGCFGLAAPPSSPPRCRRRQRALVAVFYLLLPRRRRPLRRHRRPLRRLLALTPVSGSSSPLLRRGHPPRGAEGLGSPLDWAPRAGLRPRLPRSRSARCPPTPRCRRRVWFPVGAGTRLRWWVEPYHPHRLDPPRVGSGGLRRCAPPSDVRLAHAGPLLTQLLPRRLEAPPSRCRPDRGPSLRCPVWHLRPRRPLLLPRPRPQARRLRPRLQHRRRRPHRRQRRHPRLRAVGRMWLRRPPPPMPASSPTCDLGLLPRRRQPWRRHPSSPPHRLRDLGGRGRSRRRATRRSARGTTSGDWSGCARLSARHARSSAPR